MNKYDRRTASVKSLPRLELYDWLQLSLWGFTGVNCLVLADVLQDAAIGIPGPLFLVYAVLSIKDTRRDMRGLSRVIAAGVVYLVLSLFPIYHARAQLSTQALLLYAAIAAVELTIVAVRAVYIRKKICFRWNYNKK